MNGLYVPGYLLTRHVSGSRKIGPPHSAAENGAVVNQPAATRDYRLDILIADRGTRRACTLRRRAVTHTPKPAWQIVLFIIFVGVCLRSCFRAVKKPRPSPDTLATENMSKYGTGVEHIAPSAYSGEHIANPTYGGGGGLRQTSDDLDDDDDEYHA